MKRRGRNEKIKGVRAVFSKETDNIIRKIEAKRSWHPTIVGGAE
jgi:hypothetical protein